MPGPIVYDDEPELDDSVGEGFPVMPALLGMTPPSMKTTMNIALPAYPGSDATQGPTLVVTQTREGYNAIVTTAVNGKVDSPEAYNAIIDMISKIIVL